MIFKGPELLSKYIGASEQAVRDMFARSVVRGQWSVVSGQWSVVSGQWSVSLGVISKFAKFLFT